MEEVNVKNKEVLVPVCEKYTLTIKEAAAYFILESRRCVDWQKKIQGDFRSFVEISSLSSVRNLKNS